MNGARPLINALVDGGDEMCFANPGNVAGGRVVELGRRRGCPIPAPAASPSVSGEAIASAAKALRCGEPGVVLIGGDATASRASPPPRGSPRPPGRGCSARPSRQGWSAALADQWWAGWATWSRLPASSWTAPSTWCWPALVHRRRSSPTRGKPSDLVPEGCQVHPLTEPTGSATEALVALADELAPDTAAPRPGRQPGTANRCADRRRLPPRSARRCRRARSWSTSR
ncbi:hypothetical protein [Pseudonocardia adelaidensis]|uniref:hypothetical protein n=1 Tax=Pseudonocardia adelaidensis TaxID=648754 RepID=UPI0031E5EB12